MYASQLKELEVIDNPLLVSVSKEALYQVLGLKHLTISGSPVSIYRRREGVAGSSLSLDSFPGHAWAQD